MDMTMRKASVYYISTLLFSWICWIASMVYAAANGIPLLFNEGVYAIFTAADTTAVQVWLFLIFTLAPYGPLFGVMMAKWLTRTRDAEDSRAVRDQKQMKWFVFVFLYPIIVFGTALLVSFMMTGFSQGFAPPTMPYWFLPLFFLFQLVTSGIEEMGWRGYLQPVLQKKYIAEKACLIVGILWSIWHYPLLVYMNWAQGPFVILLTLAGYTMLTIPQAYVLGFVYNSTKSLLWCIVLHAWANTVSAYLLVSSPLPQLTPILVAVTVWLIAEFLVRKYGKERLSTI